MRIWVDFLFFVWLMKKLLLILGLFSLNSVNSMHFPTNEEDFWIQNFPTAYKQGSFDQFYSNFKSMIDALILESRFLADYKDAFIPHIRGTLVGFYANAFDVECANCCDFMMFSKITMSSIIETIEGKVKAFGFLQMLIKGINFYFSIIIDNKTTELILDHAKNFLESLDLYDMHSHLKTSLVIT